MRARAIPAVSLALTLLSTAGGGCSSFDEGAKNDDDPPSTAADGGGNVDGGTTSVDAGDPPPPGPSDAAADVTIGPGPGPVKDDFETGTVCSPWTAVRSALTTMAGGADGSARSCNACATGSGGGGAHRTIAPVPPATELPAGTYAFTLWVRSEAYRGRLTLEVYGLSGNTKGTYIKGTDLAVTGGWITVQVGVTTTAPTPGFWVDLYQYRLSSDMTDLTRSCFQLDGFSVDYTP